MLNNKEVGEYAAAVKLSEAWYFIPIAITSSVFPAILNSKKTDEKIYIRRLENLYGFMIVMTTIIAFIVTFLNREIIIVTYGSKYIEAAGPLAINIWAGIFVAMGVASGNWLLAEDLLKFSMYSTIIGAFVNIILNFVLIPIYGINGAAIDTVISYFIAGYFSLIFWRETRPNFWMLSKSILFRKYF